MKKKLLSVLLSTAMAATMLSGCGSGTPAASDNGAAAGDEAAADDAAAGDAAEAETSTEAQAEAVTTVGPDTGTHMEM